MKTIFEVLRRCVEQGEDLMLVSIIGSTGSSPRGKGAQMLVSEAGRLCGTIGGGNVEFLADLRYPGGSFDTQRLISNCMKESSR